mmetsp:Transcript_18174/g.27032  ORF Transcript_18174/g.27032 Transcript_18174/m.27032 type:complete len:261 (+) Transcript_18174:321-1103(+)
MTHGRVRRVSNIGMIWMVHKRSVRRYDTTRRRQLIGRKMYHGLWLLSVGVVNTRSGRHRRRETKFFSRYNVNEKIKHVCFTNSESNILSLHGFAFGMFSLEPSAFGEFQHKKFTCFGKQNRRFSSNHTYVFIFFHYLFYPRKWKTVAFKVCHYLTLFSLSLPKFNEICFWHWYTTNCSSCSRAIRRYRHGWVYRASAHKPLWWKSRVCIVKCRMLHRILLVLCHRCWIHTMFIVVSSSFYIVVVVVVCCFHQRCWIRSIE